MKLTKSKLKQIIKEELGKVLGEEEDEDITEITRSELRAMEKARVDPQAAERRRERCELVGGEWIDGKCIRGQSTRGQTGLQTSQDYRRNDPNPDAEEYYARIDKLNR